MSSKKAEARERVKAMREAQARQERKKERLLRFGIAGAVVAAIVIVAVAVAATRGGDDSAAALPSGVEETGGGITVGQADAPVTIDAWIDFLCPHCKEFEDANGAAIDQLVASGQAKVVYHTLTFTGGQYSGRANNAFACAANEGKGGEFVAAAFVEQPQWNDSALVDLGESIGAGGDYESCVRDETYGGWAGDVTGTAQAAGVTGTPTIFVNGTELPNDQWTPEGVQAAVTAAGGAATTPSGSPSATTTP